MKNFNELITATDTCIDAPIKADNTQELLLKEFCYAVISTATFDNYLSIRREYVYWTRKGIDIKVLKKLGSTLYGICKEYDNIYPCFPFQNDYINGNIDALARKNNEYHAFIFDFTSKKNINVRSNEADILIGALKDTILTNEILHVRLLYIDGTSVLLPGQGHMYNIAKDIVEKRIRKRGSWCKTCEIGCGPVQIGIPVRS